MTFAETDSQARLTDAELTQYQENGWIVPAWEIPQRLIEKMRAEYDALLARNPDVASDIILAPHRPCCTDRQLG